MKFVANKLIQIVLSVPSIFEWQQRICNNYSVLVEEFQEYLTEVNKKILDVGCSTGTCAGTIFDMEKNKYTGIDLDSKYIQIAAKRFPKGNFAVMNGQQLGFPDIFFDIIFLNATIHHMPDEIVRICFKEVHRTLNSNGFVLIAEPVFTKGWHFSNFLLSLDRGRYIRTRESYEFLFDCFKIVRQNYFKFSVHRFCSFVLRKQNT